jgi:outer membrane protein assembly factor BamB
VSYRYATVAYDAATGEELWEASYHPAGRNFNAPNDIAVSETGDRVFVTGQINKSQGLPTDVLGPRLGADNDFGTVAYDGSTGRELWSADLGTPGFDFEFGLGVASSPDGSTAYVTGVSSSFLTSYALARSGQLADQLTVAYDGATGAQRWIGRLNATGYDFDIGFDVEVTADGGTVVTAGQLEHEIVTDDDPYDVGIAAYRTS